MGQAQRIIAAVKARLIYSWFFLTGNLSAKTLLLIVLPAALRPRIKADKPFNLFGHPVRVPPGTKQDITFINFIHQIIGHNQYRVELIPPHGVVVDAGANMGVFSIFAAIKRPQATIFAFEPNPETFVYLKENTAPYPNIKVFNSGLGERVKKAELVLTGHPASCYISDEPASGKTISVDIKTIDSLNMPVSFIKMDTERYEGQIIAGARETIKKHKPTLVMSAYHKPNDEVVLSQLLNSITAYTCELHVDAEKILPADQRKGRLVPV